MPALTTTAPTASLFDRRPLVIAALHLPDLALNPGVSMSELEDYVLGNCATFARAGIAAVKLQDETREPGRCRTSTVAVMAALGRLIRRENPELSLGIIVQAHDPVSPIAIAHATGADFVRLKIFVGSAMTSEGPKDALGVEATAYRASLGAGRVAILADVHDRTCVPIGGVPADRAALWAQSLGADALVITGADFSETLARIAAARAAGVKRPILIGGGVDADNAEQAFGHAQGAVVSTSMMRPGAGSLSPGRWDLGRCRAVVEAAARGAASGGGPGR